MNKYLLSPGPVPVGIEAALASARPMISHRSGEYHELYAAALERLSRLLRSSGPVVIFPSSGTGALEALAANFCGASRVLSASCGVFGDRWREIAARFGTEITPLDAPMGEGTSPEAAARAARACSPEAVLITLNETSTGVTNPVRDIIRAVEDALPPDSRPLFFVDGVSGVGAMPCFPEDWGIDGLAFASQKGLLTPPGLGLVWLSPRAWSALERRAPAGSYYFDLLLQRKFLRDGAPENPYTPPVSLYRALVAALDEILAEPAWFELRARAARALAEGASALGLEPLVRDPSLRSAGVTALRAPGGDASALTARLKEMGVLPAGGMGALKGKIIRVAHYHDVRWPELAMILGSLWAALGAPDAPGFIERAYSEYIKGE